MEEVMLEHLFQIRLAFDWKDEKLNQSYRELLDYFIKQSEEIQLL